MMNKTHKIVITGGGSGGHTMPAVSVYELIKERYNNNVQVLYIGSHHGIEKDIALSKNIDYKSISTGKLRRYFSIKNFFDIFKVLLGIIQSFFIVQSFKPEVIFSTGGFVSVPVVLGAKILRLKIIIHEQTIHAGLANRINARFADKIALTFQESLQYFPKAKSTVTGIPIRKEVLTGTNNKFIKEYSFNEKLPVLYFTGGGLGCHLLNTTFIEIAGNLLENYNIIFQTGNADDGNDYERMLKLRNSLSDIYKGRFALYKFITDDIGNVYHTADIAIARSGAGTVNELIATATPAIFIPLQIAAGNEQMKNAMVMKNIETAEIIEENELTTGILKNTILKMTNHKELTIMKKKLDNIRNRFVGNEKIIEIISYYLKD